MLCCKCTVYVTNGGFIHRGDGVLLCQEQGDAIAKANVIFTSAMKDYLREIQDDGPPISVGYYFECVHNAMGVRSEVRDVYSTSQLRRKRCLVWTLEIDAGQMQPKKVG